MRVLQSFSSMRDTTNPYLKQLFSSLASAGTDVTTFSWSAALRGRFDVLHVHWPEVMFRSDHRLKVQGRRLAFAALLLRLSWGGRRLVRTVHNLSPHEELQGVEKLLMRWCDRRTHLWITLVDQTPPPGGSTAPKVTIPHGDYREWFAGTPVPPTVTGRILYFGLVRAYKGVDDLVDAFTATTLPGVALHVVGSVRDDALSRRITARAAADDRISLVLRYVGDAELAAEIGAAELVVLPYRDMHNSGAALLALSLDRPILVPANAITEQLAAEVGPGWVLTFDGALTPAILEAAVTAVRAGASGRARPDLQRREWPGIAEQHIAAYRSALAAGSGHR